MKGSYLLLSTLLLSSSVLLVNGVGFRFRADRRTGRKELWLHAPGSEPIVLTDFDDKPYNGPKNLIDVNRPGENKPLQKPRPSYQNDGYSRPVSGNTFNNNQNSMNDGNYRRPSPRPTLQPRPSPSPTTSKNRNGEEGYFYPKPSKPFNPSGGQETSTSRAFQSSPRPSSKPQVGYPDVPNEENVSFGKNSEGNKDIFSDRPVRPQDYQSSNPFRPTQTSTGRPQQQDRRPEPGSAFDRPGQPGRFPNQSPHANRYPSETQGTQRPQQQPNRLSSGQQLNFPRPGSGQQSMKENGTTTRRSVSS